MDENGKEKIVEQLRQSGTILELTTSRALNEHGWEVRFHPYYPADDNGIKESDICAVREDPKLKNGTQVLIIECKKSTQRPWVFFESNTICMDALTLNIVANSQLAVYGIYEKQMAKHHYSKQPYCHAYLTTWGKTAENKTESSNDIYSAITQVLKGLQFYWNRHETVVSKTNPAAIQQIYPIIVFDGELFSAFVDEKEEIKLTQREHILLYQLWELDDYVGVPWSSTMMKRVLSKPFIIDVVHKDFFKKYLEYI